MRVIHARDAILTVPDLLAFISSVLDLPHVIAAIHDLPQEIWAVELNRTVRNLRALPQSPVNASHPMVNGRL